MCRSITVPAGKKHRTMNSDAFSRKMVDGPTQFPNGCHWPPFLAAETLMASPCKTDQRFDLLQTDHKVTCHILTWTREYSTIEREDKRRTVKGRAMAEMTRWLWERLFESGGLIERLQPLGVAQEEEIQRLCEEEIAAWRARPTMRVEASLQEPLRHARNSVRERLAVGEDNRWFNPREGAYEHLALKYLNFTPDQWNDLRADSEERFARRLVEQQQITNPDALVSRAEELLKGTQWSQLSLSITLATGRRVTEVLKTAKFSPKTAYTLWFEGQLKTKDRVLPPYEIPTLVEARLVLDAVKRLRESLDGSRLSNDEVSSQYGPIVRKLADQQLGDLIEKRSKDVNLYTHLSRCIYGRLCVLYFCAPKIFDLHYMATILEHFWYVDEKHEKRRHNLQRTLHYYDYVIGDGHGNSDGRRGIRLCEPGVVVIDAMSSETAESEM